MGGLGLPVTHPIEVGEYIAVLDMFYVVAFKSLLMSIGSYRLTAVQSRTEVGVNRRERFGCQTAYLSGGLDEISLECQT